MKSIDVLLLGTPKSGWGPIDRLGNLAGQMLQGTVMSEKAGSGTLLERLSMIAGQGGLQNTTEKTLLVIARKPRHMRADALPAGLMKQYGQAFIWVIDGFRHEELIPKWRLGPYDGIFVCRPNDEPVYAAQFGKPVHVLPWGADALGQGSGTPDRPYDVMRIGRQPADWDDDTVSAMTCDAKGLSFSGRPGFLGDPLTNHGVLMRKLSETRFALAHCNLAAPAPYTHPTQAYITGRWTDALAAGASVAGIAPHQDLSTGMLWDGALVEFDRIDLRHNVEALREACDRWHPDHAKRNYREALLHLDWRWRLQTICDLAGVSSAPLSADLKQIRTLATVLADPPAPHKKIS